MGAPVVEVQRDVLTGKLPRSTYSSHESALVVDE